MNRYTPRPPAAQPCTSAQTPGISPAEREALERSLQRTRPIRANPATCTRMTRRYCTSLSRARRRSGISFWRARGN